MEEVEKLINEGKYKDAVKLLKGQSDSPEKFYYLALAYFKSGKLREALRNIVKAVRMKSDPKFLALNAYILYTLGYESGDDKMIEKALNVMEKALEADKKLEEDVEFLTYKANVLYELGKFDEALKVVDKAITIKDDLKLHKLRGDILFNLGKFDEAIKEYEKDLNNDENLYALGFTYFKMREYEKALEYLDKAISLKPDNPYYYETRAEVLLSMGKKDEAMQEIQKALELDPDNPYLVSTEVEILSHIDPDKAYKAFKEFFDVYEEFRELICEDIAEKSLDEKVRKKIDKLCASI